MKMSEEKHHIDDYFKESLKDLEYPAPNDSWKNIENQLGKNRRGGMITIWRGMAAGLALLLGVGVYMKYISHEQKIINSNQIAHVPQNVINPGKTILKKNNFNAYSTISNSNKVTIYKNIESSTSGNNKLLIEKDKKNNDGQSNGPAGNTILEIVDNSTYTYQPEDKETETSKENLRAVNPSNEYTLHSISPMGIELESSQGSIVVLKKESNVDNNPMPEPEFILAKNENIPEVKKIKHWSIAGQVAPSVSYRKSEQSSGTDQNDEKALIAYVGGLKVDYKTSRRFSIQAGVFYSVVGQTLNNVKGTSYPVLNQGYSSSLSSNVIYYTGNSMGPIVDKSNNSRNSDPVLLSPNNDISKNNYTSNITAMALSASNSTTATATIIQELKFIEVPLIAKFKIIDKKIGLNLLGGISTNFLVNNNALLKHDGTTESDWEVGYINKINYSGTLGLGVNYEFLKRIDFSIEPTYKYYINSISANKDFNYHPYSFGIFTGIIYKF